MKIIGDPKITGFEKLFPAEEENRGWVRLGEETFQLEKVNCLYSTSVWNLKHSLNLLRLPHSHSQAWKQALGRERSLGGKNSSRKRF